MKRKPESKNLQEKSRAGSGTPPVYTMWTVFCIAYIALKISGWLFPSPSIWSFDLSAYLPVPIVVASLLFAILAAFPRLYESFTVRVGMPPADAKGPAAMGSVTALVGVMAVILVAAIVFPVRAHLLGNSSDILVRIENVFLGHAFPAGVLYYTQPISTFMYLEVAKIAHSIFNSETVLAFRLVGYLCWLFFAVGAWIFSRSLSFDTWSSVTVMALLLALPSSVFFFGYVEYYTIMYTLLMWYFALCARTFSGSGSIVLPGIVLAAAIGAHITAVLLVPSYLILFIHRHQPEWISTRRIAAVLASVTVASLAYYLLSDASRSHGFFIPLRADSSVSYTLLSPDHVLDILNLFAFYLAPALLLFAAGMHAARPGIPVSDARTLFALVAVSFPTMFVLSWNSLLGMARDWDVPSFWALSLVSSLVIFLCAIPKLSRMLRVFAIPMTLLALSANLPWIALNATEGASIERYMALVRMYAPSISRQGTVTGYENIRKIAALSPNRQFEIDILSEMLPYTTDPFDLTKLTTAIRLSPEPGQYGTVMTDVGTRLDTMLAMYTRPGGMSPTEKDAVERNFRRTAVEYVNYYISRQRPDAAIDFSQRLIYRYPELPYGYITMAYVHMHLGDSEAALRYSRIARQKGSEDVLLLCTKGFAEMLLGMGDSAFVTLSRAVEIDPDFGKAHYELGMYHLRFRNDTTTALVHLRRYLTLSGDEQGTQFARDLVQSMED